MDVFPALAGLAWPVVKTPQFNTIVEQAVSGRENRVAQMAFPKWSFTLQHNLLRDDPTSASPAAPLDELKKLEGFFLKQNGSAKAFLYSDPTDSTVTDMQFGTGDGVTVAFQLVRSYGAGGFTLLEPVQNLNGAVTNIKDAGNVVSGGNYNVSATGLVTFNAAPANGHALTWSGSFYYRVRFLEDANDFTEFAFNLWELQKMQFTGSPGNKV